LIAIYQLVPIGYLFLLVKFREKLNPDADTPEQALAMRDKDQDLNPIRFLFNDLKCDRWFHEVVDMYRRIIFIGVLPLVEH